jgi:NAD(P)-dependent dehydrogenase (short-subunit alcohol dehydrogenase family)
MAQLTNVVALVTGASRGGGRADRGALRPYGDAHVESLFARIRDEHGRLDVLVNNVWGGCTSRRAVSPCR